MPWTSKKAVSHQKRPSAVKKGHEGCHGRLVHAADIKKVRRLSKKAVSRQKGREGFHGRLVRAADIKKGCWLSKKALKTVAVF